MRYGDRVEAEIVALLRAAIALLMLPFLLGYAAVTWVAWLLAGLPAASARVLA